MPLTEADGRSDRLAAAIALAADVHAGQTDRGGAPYVLHPLRVMEDAMRVEDGLEEVGIAAVLHDALEDRPLRWDPGELRRRIELDFGYGALEAVELLTRAPGDDYFDYVQRIIDSETWATTVKMADLRDNMDIRRQPTLQDRDLLRLQRYHMSYRMLREAR